MVNELFKVILLSFLTFGFVLFLPAINKIVYRNRYSRNLNSDQKFYGKNILKIIALSTVLSEKRFDVKFIITTIILILGIGIFPYTSDIWVDGSFYRTSFYSVKYDFIYIICLILTVNFIDLFSAINSENVKSSEIIITKTYFSIIFIINCIALLLFFRSTDLVNIIQTQEGGTSELLGNLPFIKNPLSFISQFFCFLVFLKTQNPELAKKRRHEDSKLIFIENLKMFFVSLFLVYFYLGGYSIVLFPEKVLDNVPIIYNLFQLVFVFLKLAIIFIFINYFKDKISIGYSKNFSNFFFKLIFLVSLIGLMVEIFREASYGII
jgi:NADH:ubiquinone oxidoreductase subunit H